MTSPVFSLKRCGSNIAIPDELPICSRVPWPHKGLYGGPVWWAFMPLPACVKAKGTANVAHWGSAGSRATLGPRPVILLCPLLQCLAGKCRSGELGNFNEKNNRD